MKRFIVELKDCEENLLFDIPSGTSYVEVQGKDANTVTRQLEDIIYGNSEMHEVGEVNVVNALPEGVKISNEWSSYLEIKNKKFFDYILQN